MTGADVARWDSLSRTYAYGPTLVDMPMPPMPVPSAMRSSRVTVVCTIDERGRVVRLSMTPFRDAAYGRRLAKAWRVALQFKPATTLEGVPIKGYYRLTYDF
jgi:hypothetical protein